MKTLATTGAIALFALSGCASLSAPTAEGLAGLPVIAYPATPPAGDYVYKLPAGEPIDLRLLVDGSALATHADHTVTARLGRDLYLYKRWASEDGKRWVNARDLIGVELDVVLPSYDTPRAGEMHLTVNRKETP